MRVQEHEVHLLTLLSEPLQQELKHETFSMYLRGHALFRTIGDHARVYGKALESCYHAFQEILFGCSEKAEFMWFSTSGCLQYALGIKGELPSSIPLTGFDASDLLKTETSGLFPLEFLDEGCWIAESVLWTPWIHQGDLQAVTEVQVIKIDAKMFVEMASGNDSMWNAVTRYAEAFLTKLNSSDVEELTDLTFRLFNPEDLVEPEHRLLPDFENPVEDIENRLSKLCDWVTRRGRRLSASEPPKSWTLRRSETSGSLVPVSFTRKRDGFNNVWNWLFRRGKPVTPEFDTNKWIVQRSESSTSVVPASSINGLASSSSIKSGSKMW